VNRISCGLFGSLEIEAKAAVDDVVAFIVMCLLMGALLTGRSVVVCTKYFF